MKIEIDMSKSLLPNGKTCKDCVGFKMCVSFFSDLESSTTCKWTPDEFKINKKRKIGSNKLANNKKIKGQNDLADEIIKLDDLIFDKDDPRNMDAY